MDYCYYQSLYSVEVIEAESEYEEDTFTVDTGEGSSRQEEIVKMNDIASEVVKQVMNTIE